MAVDEETRRLVVRRAGGLCEYCQLPAGVLGVPPHVEHIRAKQHDGTDDAANLALACDRCNLAKGPNLSAYDPQTDRVTLLFHPRLEDWDQHFEAADGLIVGKTATGRATAKLFQMNHPRRVALRRALPPA
jgi:hypothetical protein